MRVLGTLLLFLGSALARLGNDQEHHLLLEILSSDNGRRLGKDDEVRVIVGYKNKEGREAARSLMKEEGSDLEGIEALAGLFSVDDLLALSEDPNIEYVETDEVLRAAAGPIVPYGIAAVQNSPGSALANSASYGSFSCSDPNSLKVAILDTSVDAGHPNLPCKNGAGCIGKEFTPWESKESWDSTNEDADHGTMCFGIIAAAGQGLVGMVHDTQVCYIVARVLDSSGEASSSGLLAGVEWALQQGAKVINMSIAGGSFQKSANKLYRKAFQDFGALVVAAAGNDGKNMFDYPASYADVIAVAATGEDLDHAWFSNVNSEMDVCAPGRNIFSTKSRSKDNIIAAIDAGGKTFAGMFVENAPVPTNTVSGALVNCPDADGKDPCPGPGGHVCIIERGDEAPPGVMARKASRCEEGNGVAVIIYASRPDDYLERQMGSGNGVGIPAISVSFQDGQELLRSYQGQQLAIETLLGYGVSQGTSFAAPHVTGAIAALWQACPQCSNTDIDGCIRSTALDLGASGRDSQYGHGLLQTNDAFQCLQSQAGCC